MELTDEYPIISPSVLTDALAASPWMHWLSLDALAQDDAQAEDDVASTSRKH